MVVLQDKLVEKTCTKLEPLKMTKDLRMKKKKKKKSKQIEKDEYMSTSQPIMSDNVLANLN